MPLIDYQHFFHITFDSFGEINVSYVIEPVLTQYEHNVA